MSIKKDTKKEIISKFATNEKDTGSPQVQIAVLSERINNLTEHFKTFLHGPFHLSYQFVTPYQN